MSRELGMYFEYTGEPHEQLKVGKHYLITSKGYYFHDHPDWEGIVFVDEQGTNRILSLHPDAGENIYYANHGRLINIRYTVDDLLCILSDYCILRDMTVAHNDKSALKQSRRYERTISMIKRELEKITSYEY